jgi:hypothetical protein
MFLAASQLSSVEIESDNFNNSSISAGKSKNP